MKTTREKIRFWFDDLETPMGRLVDFAVMALILLGCVLLVLETYDLGERANATIWAMEWVVMGLFIVEYVLRFWSAERRLTWMLSPYAIIDLLAILPALLALTPHLQIFRVLRVLRVMRLTRYLEDRRFFFGTIRQHHLGVVRIAFTLFAIIFIASALIWHFEAPHRASQIHTFGDALYFSLVTVTTVGFGDMTPTTLAGRLTTMLMIIAGVVLIPWQIRNLIATGTAPSDDRTPNCPRCGLRRHRLEARYCWRCGEPLSAPPPES